MGFCHDLGKATGFFQDYLSETGEAKKASMRGSQLTSHALLSALIAHFVCKKIEETSPCENELWQVMPFFVFLCIKRHHGNMKNAVNLGNNDDDNELDIEFDHVDTQFKNLTVETLEHFLSILNKRLDLSIQSQDLPESFAGYFKKNIYKIERKRVKKLTRNHVYYFIFQYLFSLLIQSDKEDAIFSGTLEITRKPIPEDIVKKYIHRKFGPPKTEMNRLRSEIFAEAEQTMATVDLDTEKIFSLNVPTGSGKTFTCLSLALQLRERLKKEKGGTPRIIYTLPFTSIIDQNHDVFKSIFEDPDSDILIKHHHLSEMFYHTADDDFETDESKFLIESWRSEVVVTTMFQLFHTLLTNQNRMLIKYETLVNAVVLCDEIQSLPYKYWELARKIISCFSKLFNTYFILVTATQPKLFDPNEITELIPGKARYFSALNRVSIEFGKTALPLKEYKKLCTQAVLESPSESFLFVMNTVNAALKLFEALAKSDSDAAYFFLSTNIIPAARLQVISDIKKMTQRKIIVSTQMIEAGVDIDVDNVWRDMAPLESINQVCGRCNRNFKQAKGKVKIFQILNDEHQNTPFEKYIYGRNPLSINQTRKAISGKDVIDETEFLENMEQYYTKIKQRLRGEDSGEIVEYIENLQFLSVYNNFKLIEDENYERKDVFIEIDQKAADTWEDFLKIGQIENKLQRKMAFLKIRNSFYDYIISVPSKFVSEKEFEQTNFIYISKDMVDGCYKRKTGWIRKKDEIYTF